MVRVTFWTWWYMDPQRAAGSAISPSDQRCAKLNFTITWAFTTVNVVSMACTDKSAHSRLLSV